MYKKMAEEMMSFIKESPTAFHVVDNIKTILEAEGYQELLEGERWEIVPGGKYYITRNNSSMIALNLGKSLEKYSFNIAASHGDSPTFKVKENAEIEVKGKYVKLNTEGYGGMLCAPWFDRPLSVAGRVIVKEKDTYTTRLVKIDRDLLLIPNVAIHMNRKVNDGYAYNKQIDMLPLFGGTDGSQKSLKTLIARELEVDEDDICTMDLYLYNRMEPSIWGADEEYISCPQLDDLQCVYSSLLGFLKGENDKSINVFACFDNEEVGSRSKQGAGSTFIYDVLHRVNRCLGKDEESFYRALASSFMLSCDNVHAMHPNHPEKTDENNCVYMNEGIVVKSQAEQKYTSDAVSIAIFKGICEKAEVPLQFFANRSDEAGGSTLGNIAMSQVSVNCIDIGLPQLAMHSPYETAGIKDTYYMIRAIEEFFNSHVESVNGNTLMITK